MIRLAGNKFLVTGGAGFIGSHICEEIVKQGKQVICFDNFVAGKQENLKPWWDSQLCELAVGDVQNRREIGECIQGVDVIFHNAASKCTVCRNDPLLDLLTNAWGTLNIFEIASKHGIKVIHASTGSINGYRPLSYYGVSKMAGESYARVTREYHPSFRYVILRYYHVYGPRQDSSPKGGVIPIFIKAIERGDPVRLHDSGVQTRHFTYVKDVVNANFLAANDDFMDYLTYDVLSDVTISIKDLYTLLHGFMGTKNNAVNEPQRPGDIRHFDVSNSLIKEYGFTPEYSLAEGLQETIKWYVDNV